MCDSFRRLQLLAELESLVLGAPESGSLQDQAAESAARERAEKAERALEQMRLAAEEEASRLRQEIAGLKEASRSQTEKLSRTQQAVETQRKTILALQERLEQAGIQAADADLLSILRLENEQLAAQKEALQKQLAGQARSFEAKAAEQVRARAQAETLLSEARGEAALLRIRLEEAVQKKGAEARAAERVERLQKIAQAAAEGEVRARQRVQELEETVEDLRQELEEQDGLLLSMEGKGRKTGRLGAQVKTQMVIFEE